MADFLFELGLEEVPARMLASAQDELSGRVWNLLQRERLLESHSEIQSFSTPRRLAVLVHGVAPQQADAQEDLLGPPVKAAYKDGEPTPAAHAFAKKAGVDLAALRTVTNAKGEYLAATVTHAGRSASAILEAELPKEIAAIYWAKSMVWRPGKPERFVRPVQWIVALLDDAVVPIAWAGITAGRESRGHRILHGASPVVIDRPQAYREALRSAFVLANVEERRHRIRKALDHVTRAVAGARWREDHPLVDKVTHLTEWPSVLLGSFEADFLQLPEEVLVTVMRDHQNYFAPEGTDGKLLPHFLAVLNTEPSAAATEIIRHNNERVLRARFNDAKFFYDFDQRTPLEDRVHLLEKVTFQKDLGSYAAKSENVSRLATELALSVRNTFHAQNVQRTVDVVAIQEAARLCKTDLTTELVKEFTELQGIVGGLYALEQGKDEVVSAAIYDQYLPASMEDAIPRTIEGLLLSIADKADTIQGMFGLGLQPTGSKDPFALRRAANGIVRMLAEGSLPLTLEKVAEYIGGADKRYASSKPQFQAILDFFTERFDWYLREKCGFAYDVVRAVLATRNTDVGEAILRAQALSKARPTEDFAAIIAAFKRMKNIVAQARAKGEPINPDTPAPADAQIEETTLASEAACIASQAADFSTDRNYDAALASIATLRPAIDAFFEKVMVMAPEPELRAFRLGLLQRLLNNFSTIADFSEIVISG